MLPYHLVQQRRWAPKDRSCLEHSLDHDCTRYKLVTYPSSVQDGRWFQFLRTANLDQDVVCLRPQREVCDGRCGGRLSLHAEFPAMGYVSFILPGDLLRMERCTYPAFLLLPPLSFFVIATTVYHPLPPCALKSHELVPLAVHDGSPLVCCAVPVVDP